MFFFYSVRVKIKIITIKSALALKYIIKNYAIFVNLTFSKIIKMCQYA